VIKSKYISSASLSYLIAQRCNLKDEIKANTALLEKIEKELLRRQPKTVFVSWDNDSDAGYKFELETKKGRRRVRPAGCRPGEEVCLESGQLRAWFKNLKVTHIESKFGETKTSHECIKDGKYSIEAYLKWWKRLGDGEDD
jgi:hypothetical protein